MEQVTPVGLDLAKKVFQVHAVDAAGAPVVRRALRRRQVLSYFAKLPRCLVGIEACATAHYWTIVESLRGLEQRIERVEKQIVGWGRGNATCRHLITIPGYGPILSTAMAAMVVDPAAFTSARHFSASLGMVPRQDGTGGKSLPLRRRGSSSVRSASAATAICAGCWSTACPRA